MQTRRQVVLAAGGDPGEGLVWAAEAAARAHPVVEKVLASELWALCSLV